MECCITLLLVALCATPRSAQQCGTLLLHGAAHGRGGHGEQHCRANQQCSPALENCAISTFRYASPLARSEPTVVHRRPCSPFSDWRATVSHCAKTPASGPSVYCAVFVFFWSGLGRGSPGRGPGAGASVFGCVRGPGGAGGGGLGGRWVACGHAGRCRVRRLPAVFSRGLECVSAPLGFFARLFALVCLYEFPSVRFGPCTGPSPLS
jgi:hypothetical protein